MRYLFLSAIFALLIFTSCKKEKFNTIPTLKFISVNNTELFPGQLLKFSLSFTDAEGDVSDSIFVIKNVPNCPASGFTQGLSVPDFPNSKNQKGDIDILLGYKYDDPGFFDVGQPKCMMTDTAYFKFVLRDKKNNLSDTAVSPAIIIHY